VSAGCRPFILLRKTDDFTSAPCHIIRPRPMVRLSDWLSRISCETIYPWLANSSHNLRTSGLVTMICLLRVVKNSSGFVRDQIGNRPPPDETCHGPPGPGLIRTYITSKPQWASDHHARCRTKRDANLTGRASQPSLNPKRMLVALQMRREWRPRRGNSLIELTIRAKDAT
jgi:hypothetical protein